MTDKAYFLSDLHLGSAEEPNAFLLIKFLKSLKSREDITHLFLMGDIFDLWVADHKYFVIKFAPIIAELRRLKNAGVEIHYFEGNHDLYLEHFFAREMGMLVHKDAASFVVAGLRLRAEHGDLMNLNDREYIYWRSFLRSMPMKFIAPRLRSDWVTSIGEWLSKKSRENTTKHKVISPERAKKIIHDHAVKCYMQEKLDLHISGHVHVTEDVYLTPQGPHRPGIRVVNLGSWFDDPKVFYLSKEKSGFIHLKDK